MRVPVSNTDGSRVVSYIDGTGEFFIQRPMDWGFYMSGTTVVYWPGFNKKSFRKRYYYTSYSDTIDTKLPSFNDSN